MTAGSIYKTWVRLHLRWREGEIFSHTLDVQTKIGNILDALLISDSPSTRMFPIVPNWSQLSAFMKSKTGHWSRASSNEKKKHLTDVFHDTTFSTFITWEWILLKRYLFCLQLSRSQHLKFCEHKFIHKKYEHTNIKVLRSCIKARDKVLEICFKRWAKDLK